MFIEWIIVAMATFLLANNAYGQSMGDNTPPVMWLDRNWILSEAEPVGSIVTRVRAEDSQFDDLIFGLEPLGHSYNGDDSPQPPLPFSINNETGTIYVNETLKGKGGQNLFLYVTVSDGQLTAKTEVYVNIRNSSTPNISNTRSPFPSYHGSGGRIRPPLLTLPNAGGYIRPSVPLKKIKSNEDSILLNNNRTNGNFSSSPNTTLTADDVNLVSYEPLDPNELHRVRIDASADPTLIDNSSSKDIAMILVPVAAVCALLFGFGMGAWSLKGKLCRTDKKSKENTKKQTSVRIFNISDEPSLMLKSGDDQMLRNNKYEEWSKNNHQQLNQSVKQPVDEWEFPRHRLKVFNILGEGCFGQVWKCEAIDIDKKSGPSIVAVKTLKENAIERERVDLAQELKIMKTLEQHPNVVRLLGCCTERDPIFVIMEYISGGKLQSFLRASREERNRGGVGLTSSDLTGFVYQIAKGMQYLASKGIIHRDLAARNILIDENRVCKVADFGFARDVAANKIYERKSEGRLPIRWMAPESLYDNIFSVKSDIWSFGVLIWEIVTLGSTPYPGMAAADVMRKIKEGYRLDRPEHCKRELYNIMYYCWDKDATCRPSFEELAAMAEGLLLDETDYIELDRFPDHSYYNVLSLSGEKL
ncbi:hypothetical protein PV327_009872 [Microctonus hyperodae]|uniref:receptor protein-tyrosine kinase n=1 Tax=Microctonus hyperodae TaxID=165561 RepID=A0AA39F1V6_MICHY|nr:hypothetical protein PV327_009872 [Microctonus hyperodae]